jgi:hypothetical protein
MGLSASLVLRRPERGKVHMQVTYRRAAVRCDLCRGDALLPRAVLLLPVEETGDVAPRRAVLLTPSGEALYGDSFVLCPNCTRSLPEAMGYRPGWQPLSLLQALVDLGRMAEPVLRKVQHAEGVLEECSRYLVEAEERDRQWKRQAGRATG